jgi:hypothetical protein
MTRKKDLKRHVRARQQRTGESYVAARRAVLADRDAPPPAPTTGTIDVVEMDDCTELAHSLGFRCSVAIARHLAAQVAAPSALARLREVLLGTLDDPAFDAFRAVALRGERPVRPRLALRWPDELRRFVARVRVGVGGVSEGGTIVAIPVGSSVGVPAGGAVGVPADAPVRVPAGGAAAGALLMVCHLGFGLLRPEQRPSLVLTTVDHAGLYVEPIAMRAFR